MVRPKRLSISTWVMAQCLLPPRWTTIASTVTTSPGRLSFLNVLSKEASATRN
ncbi:hypothetical protein FOZG_18554 [Fusarium oxysporum Fo47]|uniref:Uncharacterized protein n=1 Tax=Fusarium oxysporum Fo47 TaxID=660027 RepID=W9JE36_FUSOX|nr:hypothetical protein FOZG_18554 [Fusarium oxysporum Fo47]